MNCCKKIVVLLLAVMAATQVWAQRNELRIPDVEVYRGTTVMMPVLLDNDSTVAGVEFRLTLPTGLTLNTSSIATTVRSDGFTVAARQMSTGVYKMVLYSAESQSLTGHSGAILQLPITAADTLRRAVAYSMSLSDVILATGSGADVVTGYTAGTITPMNPIDLELSGVTVQDSSLMPGDTLHISWQVSNRGDQTANAGFVEYLYLLDEDGNSWSLKNYTVSDTLPGGTARSYRAAIPLSAVPRTDGVEALRVRVNYNVSYAEPIGGYLNNVDTLRNAFTLGKKLYLSPALVSLTEKNNPSQTWTLQRSGRWTADESFTITCDADPRLSMPGMVTIYSGNGSNSFSASVTADGVYDSHDTLYFHCGGNGYDSVAGTLAIKDDGYPDLYLKSGESNWTADNKYQFARNGSTWTLDVVTTDSILAGFRIATADGRYVNLGRSSEIGLNTSCSLSNNAGTGNIRMSSAYENDWKYRLTLTESGSTWSLMAAVVSNDTINDDEWAILCQISRKLRFSNGISYELTAEDKAVLLRGSRIYTVNGHVIRLDMSNMDYVGNIPSEFGLLPRLRELNLSQNGFCDLDTILPTHITTLNLGHQTIWCGKTLNTSTLTRDSLLSKIPRILIYDHSGQQFLNYVSYAVLTPVSSFSAIQSTDFAMYLYAPSGSNSLTRNTYKAKEYTGQRGDSIYLHVRMVDSSTGSYYWTPVGFVHDFLDGDANLRDGVKQADVDATVQYAFNQYTGLFNHSAADSYRESESRINVQDVVCTTNYMLDTTVQAAAETNRSNVLSIPDAKLYAGFQTQVPIFLTNTSDIVAAEFVLTVPTGINLQTGSISTTSRTGNHQMQVQKLSTGKYRFMLYASSNQSFSGTSGEVLQLPFTVDDSLARGTQLSLTLSDVVLAIRTGEDVTTDFQTGTITICTPADLAPTRAGVSPAQLMPGDTLTARWTVSNVGDRPLLGGWRESLYLVDTDGKQLSLGSLTVRDTLVAGDSVSRSYTYVLPAVPGMDGALALKVSLTAINSSEEPVAFRTNNTLTAANAATLGKRLTLTPTLKSVKESNNPTLSWTLTRSGRQVEADTYSLTSNADGRFALPASVTIPASSSSASFSSQITADWTYNDLDTVVLTLAGNNYEPARTTVVISDDGVREDEWAILCQISQKVPHSDGSIHSFTTEDRVSMLQANRIYPVDGHIIRLDMSDMDYVGSIPSEFGRLPLLQNLNLSKNGFCDLDTILPTHITTLNLGHQTIWSGKTLNSSTLTRDSLARLLPRIFFYDHSAQQFSKEVSRVILTPVSCYDSIASNDFAVYMQTTSGSDQLTRSAYKAKEYIGQRGDSIYLMVLNQNSYFGCAGFVHDFLSADANMQGGVDATDLQTTVNYAFNTYSGIFNRTAADTYLDSYNRINVQDVVCTVNILLAQDNLLAAPHRNIRKTSGESLADAHIYIRGNQVILSTTTPVAALCIRADGPVQWTISQQGLTQSTGADRVVAYSLNGNTLPTGETVIGTCADGVQLLDASLADAEAEPISVDFQAGRGIQTGLETPAADATSREIYDVLGRRLSRPTQGVNIVGGKKIIWF